MAFGIDCTKIPSLSAMQEHDPPVTFVCRYLSEENAATETKILTPAEAKMLGQARIPIVSNYEWTGTTALGGFNAGVADAKIAAAQHAACGGPADRPIYFSVDFNTTATATIIDYFKGVASIIGIARVGAYGGYQDIKGLFDAGVIRWGWQTYAWSNGQWEPRAQIQQYQNGVTLGGRSVDYDRSMVEDFGQWFPGGGAMQIYSPQSANFNDYFVVLNNNQWECKQTKHIVQYGHLGFYAKLSMDGESLPIAGLPLSSEIYLPLIDGKQVVLMIYERFGVYYDPSHVKDHQPGTGDFSICHLTDPDFLSRIPGLVLPPAPQPALNLSDAIATLQALGTEEAAKIAQALKDLGVNS